MINDKGQLLKERMEMKNIVANSPDFFFTFLLNMHFDILVIFMRDFKN